MTGPGYSGARKLPACGAGKSAGDRAKATVLALGGHWVCVDEPDYVSDGGGRAQRFQQGHIVSWAKFWIRWVKPPLTYGTAVYEVKGEHS